MKSGFIDKLVERLDRLDPESLQTHFMRLAKDRGMLETVFQAIQEGVLVVDGEARLTYANSAAEKYLGFSAETAVGRPVAGFLDDIDWDRVLRFDAKEWSRLISREIEITYPEHRFLSFYIVPLGGDDAKHNGVVIILRDVTREHKHEADMVESERIDAVKLLAAGVAHEIGNPLNALNIHLQLLDREVKRLPEDTSSDLHELLDVARTEVSRLDLIITQFLSAIRPSAPTLVVEHVDGVIKETLNLMTQEFQDRKIDVLLEFPKLVPTIKLDHDQIKQAFFNLIRNALQAMPDGGELRIVISVSDDFVSISFQDNGVGISAEELGQIFEPYHTTKEDGSGLGLMVVQRIIQDHGGELDIISKQGVGTSFTVLLPRAERRVKLLKSRGEKL
ncbi:MAG: PAS domain-containing protein [Kiritimatiellae bacterium]|nr:PAS domain-containing protein [Kiritimatiellia bacterium]